MKTTNFFLLFWLVQSSCLAQDSIPVKNQQVLDFVTKHGKSISPTYESAVCTELVIGVLKNFIPMTDEVKTNVRIIISEDVYKLMEQGSPLPKGVYHALLSNNSGIAIDDINQVLPGDFVQFWYPHSWGHCGIVKSIDPIHKLMELHSSFPSTEGYGVQEFDIPEYCYFVRLK